MRNTKFVEWVRTSKQTIISVIFALVFTTLFFIDTNYWHGFIGHTLPVIFLVILSLFITVILTYAGVIVIRSLFDVSIGLTLLIFLGQSYCSIGVARSANSDQALVTLIGLGILYVVSDFLRKIMKEVSNQKKELKEKTWGISNKLIYVLIVLFTVSFIVLVYLAINPIILSLCVYR